jgi:hypothetical protein
LAASQSGGAITEQDVGFVKGNRQATSILGPPPAERAVRGFVGFVGEVFLANGELRVVIIELKKFSSERSVGIVEAVYRTLL